MTRRNTILMLAGLALGLGSAVHPVSAAGTNGCVPRGARTVEHRDHIVVYQERRATIACKVQTHQRAVLSAYGLHIIHGAIDATRTRVIVGATADNDEGPGGIIVSAHFGNPAIHRRIESARPGVPNEDPNRGSPNTYQAVPAVVSLARGAFAWTTCPSGASYGICSDDGAPDRAVYVATADGRVQQIGGDNNSIDARSLRTNKLRDEIVWRDGNTIKHVAVALILGGTSTS